MQINTKTMQRNQNYMTKQASNTIPLYKSTKNAIKRNKQKTKQKTLRFSTRKFVRNCACVQKYTTNFIIHYKLCQTQEDFLKTRIYQWYHFKLFVFVFFEIQFLNFVQYFLQRFQRMVQALFTFCVLFL